MARSHSALHLRTGHFRTPLYRRLLPLLSFCQLMYGMRLFWRFSWRCHMRMLEARSLLMIAVCSVYLQEQIRLKRPSYSGG